MVTTFVALGLTVTTLLVFSAVGLWYTRGRVESVEDFITARDSAKRGRLTASLVASVMGVWILLSAPEAGATFGIAAAIGYAVGEALPMLVFSKIGPRIREVMPSGHSLTEYAHARYGDWTYALVLIVSVFYMFIFLAAELTGISLALSLVADVPQWVSAILVGGFVLLYTGYGGLRASMLTDTIQALLVLPLLVVVAVVTIVSFGGITTIHTGIATTDPSLLDPTASAGLQFGVALAFAILGAELINQTWWQRIYAGTDSKTVASSFRLATITNGAIVLLAALFGILAVGNTTVETPSLAFFALLGEAFPEWVVLGVVLLALLLVMSSVDTLFSAITSVITVDLPRLLSEPEDRTLWIAARGVTISVAVAAIVVSLEARSVLELFLFADLLGAAVAFPLLYGLYSTGLTDMGALVSSLAGLAVGAAYFPFPLGIAEALRSLPVLGQLLPVADPLYLVPFAGAGLVSTTASIILARVLSGEFDHDRLATTIKRLDGPATDGGSQTKGSR